MRRVSETATSSVANNHTSSINSIDIHQMPKKPRKLDFWNVIPENKVISDHVEERKKECMRPKSSQDNAKIKQLMKVTYNKRRSNILTSATLVHEIVQEFPPLATIHGVLIFNQTIIAWVIVFNFRHVYSILESSIV